MSSNFDFVIRSLSILAKQGSDAIQQKSTEVADALETIAHTLKQGEYTLTPVVTLSLQNTLTLIELQIENETCLHTIRKIKAVLFPSPLQRALKLIVRTPQDAVQSLQEKGHISLLEGTLTFSKELEQELDDELFEALLQNMSEQYREKIKLFILCAYPQLATLAPALLVRHCPNLSALSFRSLTPSFFDHKVNGVPVNMGLLMELSPYFKRLWKGGLKEAQEKETGETHLSDLDLSQFKLFLALFEPSACQEAGFNTIASMPEFFDVYALWHNESLVRLYEMYMDIAFGMHKEELKNEEAVHTLIQNFAPYFARGLFVHVRNSLYSIACELPLVSLDQPRTQQILLFIYGASGITIEEVLRRMETMLHDLTPEQLFDRIGTLTPLLASIPSLRRCMIDPLRKVLQRYLTQDVSLDTWIQIFSLPVVKEHILQIAALEDHHYTFCAMFSHTQPEMHLEKVFSFLDFVEEALSVSPEQHMRTIALCQHIRACFMRLHPDPAIQQEAFTIFSQLAASPTASEDVRAMSRVYELDMLRARGQQTRAHFKELQKMHWHLDEITGVRVETQILVGRYVALLSAIETGEQFLPGPFLQDRDFDFYDCIGVRVPLTNIEPIVPWPLGPLGPLIPLYKLFLARQGARK